MSAGVHCIEQEKENDSRALRGKLVELIGKSFKSWFSFASFFAPKIFQA